MAQPGIASTSSREFALLLQSTVAILGVLALLAGSAPIDDEMDALLALKQSLQDPMGHLDGWLQDGDDDLHGATSVNYSSRRPCNWNGVLCNMMRVSNSTGDHNIAEAVVVVVALDLSHMNLSGFISPQIGRLQNLVSLSFAVNNLTGVLPSQMCGIGGSLRYLNISNNFLGGYFPAKNISKLASLEVLDAYNNNFEGPLPLQISKLNHMRHLHMGGNYFNGTIPPEYGDMQSLVYLGLSGNFLTGRIPVELGNLVLLQELYMGYFNQFDGGIPASLGCLTELVVLDAANCGLNGSIPPQLLQNLTKLESLFLFTNSLTGPIPPEIGSLVSLRFLDLSNNRLSGRIPQQMSNLASLELLHLFRNRIHGEIPSFIGDLPSLQVLSVWQNKMTGSVPQQLGSNGNLISVDLSSNSLTGLVPPGLCSEGTLQVLILFNNHFTGPVPESLANCTQLTRIRLGQNHLTGPIPSGLLALPWLQLMEVPSNHINGSIPDDIPFHTRLGRLDFSGNQLSGSIPASIGNLSVLEALLLSDNALAGSIPQEMSSLKRLSKLDCSGNSIGGAIPAALGGCADLTYLDLSRNELEEGIPAELHNLTVLNFLNLSRNHLTGSIPSALQQMKTLTSADFSYNNLSGIIPDGGQFAAFNASSFMGNAALCGTQLMIPCNTSSGNVSSYDQLLRKVRRDPAVIYWVIVGVMSSLTAAVLLVGVFCNRHALCAFIGQNSVIHNSPAWKLTAFQKLDFTANHVLACLTDENIIGKGGSGTVYKCATPSGFVAVKRLPSSACSNYCKGSGVDHQAEVGGSSRDDHGFSAEIETLGKIRHRNIVRLLGCCSSRETNLLVYEYMPNGSLGELLHGPRGGSLDWARRFRIALEAAYGLRYLHHDCSSLIVHRDVKSNNILLDSKYEAHVADFGLAKALNNYPESMSSVAGSYGYIAPEYVYTLKVDEKSDIYSFGIVLLELLTGRRPLEPEYGEGVDIAQWVRKKVKSKEGVLEVLDSRLGPIMQQQQEMAQQVMLVLRVALHCLADLPMQRPTMREVVQMLADFPKKSSRSIKLPANSSTGKSTAAVVLGSCSPSPPDLISI